MTPRPPSEEERRPADLSAAEFRALFDSVCTRARSHGIAVQTGRFGASMAVESLNDGPVTLLLDSAKGF